MTSLDDFAWFVLTAVDTTPPQYVQYDQRIIGVPSNAMLTLGSGPDNMGELLGIPGYPQRSNDNLVTNAFVMTAADDVTTAFIAKLVPGDDAANVKLQAVVDTFTAAGVSAADVRQAIADVVSCVAPDQAAVPVDLPTNTNVPVPVQSVTLTDGTVVSG